MLDGMRSEEIKVCNSFILNVNHFFTVSMYTLKYSSNAVVMFFLENYKIKIYVFGSFL